MELRPTLVVFVTAVSIPFQDSFSSFLQVSSVLDSDITALSECNGICINLYITVMICSIHDQRYMTVMTIIVGWLSGLAKAWASIWLPSGLMKAYVR